MLSPLGCIHEGALGTSTTLGNRTPPAQQQCPKCYQVLSLRTEQRAKLWVGRQQTCATESTQSHLVQLLPLHHLLPAPLVDGIMNSDDIRHVFLLGLQQHTHGQLFYGRDTGTEKNKAFYNSRHSFRSTCESPLDKPTCQPFLRIAL